MNNEQTTHTEDDADLNYLDVDMTLIGFKAPVPWAGWTEAQRRSEFGGFLYPSWHPFACLEGNYQQSEHFDGSHIRAAKVQGAVDEALEVRKKQFAVPMHNKSSYTANTPAGALKRAA